VEIRPNGTLVHDGIVVGNVSPGHEADGANAATITLNLGWLEAANVELIVQGNPNRESRRVVLHREP